MNIGSVKGFVYGLCHCRSVSRHEGSLLPASVPRGVHCRCRRTPRHRSCTMCQLRCVCRRLSRQCHLPRDEASVRMGGLARAQSHSSLASHRRHPVSLFLPNAIISVSRRKSVKAKTRIASEGFKSSEAIGVKKRAATTYFPTRWPLQYHQRRGA